MGFENSQVSRHIREEAEDAKTGKYGTWLGRPYAGEMPESIFERSERLQAERIKRLKAKADTFTWYEAIPSGGGSYMLPYWVRLAAATDYEIAYDIRDFDGNPRVFRIGVREKVKPTAKVPARPSFDAIWVEVAETISKRGSCPRRQVGAVIVDSDNQIVATGYNGAPRGLDHCSEVGCLLDDSGRCKRTAHAEANAIVQAGRPRTVGGTLYSTDFPCSECTSLILQAGISRVVYVRPYESQPMLVSDITDMFVAAGVSLERWGHE